MGFGFRIHHPKSGGNRASRLLGVGPVGALAGVGLVVGETAGFAGLATKDDLLLTKSELKAEMGSLKQELKGEMASLKAEMESLARRVIMWTSSMILATGGLAFAAGASSDFSHAPRPARCTEARRQSARGDHRQPGTKPIGDAVKPG
jgi:hypothetical protein